MVSWPSNKTQGTESRDQAEYQTQFLVEKCLVSNF